MYNAGRKTSQVLLPAFMYRQLQLGLLSAEQILSFLSKQEVAHLVHAWNSEVHIILQDF